MEHTPSCQKGALWKGNKFCNRVSFIVKSGVYNMRHFAVIVLYLLKR